MITLTSPEPEIDKTDPYGSDVFGDRKPFGEQLQHLILSIHFEQEGLVLAIDASWGEGKTTFAKMWMQALKNKGITHAYYNAFAEDNSIDPFLSFSSCLYDALEEKKEFKEMFTKVGINLCNQLARKWTGIDLKELLEAELDRHAERRNEVEAFRTFLSSQAEKIKENNQDYPLIIIIDELDRCRPDFALQLLERIKHIFSVPHIAFVLLIHCRQLEEQVKARYGSGIDAHNYLHKFIHHTLMLPRKVPLRPVLTGHGDSLEHQKKDDDEVFGNTPDHFLRYAEKLWQYYSLNGTFDHPSYLNDLSNPQIDKETKAQIVESSKNLYYCGHWLFASLTRFYNLSLREMERCCVCLILASCALKNLGELQEEKNVNLSLLSGGDETEKTKQSLLFFSVIKVKYPDVYQDLRNHRPLDVTKIKEALKFEDIRDTIKYMSFNCHEFMKDIDDSLKDDQDDIDDRIAIFCSLLDQARIS